MIHLVYISSATRDFSHEELLNLLEQSRERNARLNITGMLLYDHGTFIQVLEGEEEDVVAVYSSILSDDRNAGNYIVQQKEIQERNFPQWSMGFKNLSDESSINMPGYSTFLSSTASPTNIAQKTDSIVNLLYSFKMQSD